MIMPTEKKGEYKIATPELIIQANMLKADKLRYYSQLKEFPWESVARRTCGITAAAMAISLFRPEVKPLDVLETACSLHEVPPDFSCSWVTFEHDGRKLTIPVGEKMDTKLAEALKDKELSSVNPPGEIKNYRPVYSLNNGYDHRGSKELFGKYGIRAEMLGDKDRPVSAALLKEKIRAGAMFMASVTNSITPWLNFVGGGPATHVLLLTDIISFDNKDWYYIVDPYSPNGERAVFIQPVEGFHEIEFNGFGTVIYPD